MPSPQGSNPSRYEPNPVDDRALDGEASQAYFALAASIESLNEVITDAAIWLSLAPSARRAVRRADTAMRQAAFAVVAYAPERKR